MNINGTTVRRGAATVLAAAAALGALAACGGGEQDQPAGPANITQAGSAVSTDASQASGQPTQSPVPATAPAGQRSPERTPAGAPEKGKPPAAGTQECTKMKVTQAQPTGGGQQHISLVFTNEGSAPCTVRGFPGVRLDGADGTSWDLTRTNKEIVSTDVPPGQHVTADLTFLAADGGGEPVWQVARFAVTPPHTTDTQILPWSAGKPVVKQDAATHPGTYIDPVRR